MQSSFEIIDYTIIFLSNTNNIDNDKDLEKKKNKIVNYWDSFKRVFEQYFDNFISYLSMEGFSLDNFIEKCQNSSHSTSLKEKIAYLESDFNKIIEHFPVENYETLYKFKENKNRELIVARGKRTEYRSILQTYNATYKHFDESFNKEEYLEGFEKLCDENDENSKKDALKDIERYENSLKTKCSELSDYISKHYPQLVNLYNLYYEYIENLKLYISDFKFSNFCEFKYKDFLNEFKKNNTYNENNFKTLEKVVNKYLNICKIFANIFSRNRQISEKIKDILNYKEGINHFSPTYIFYDAKDYNHEDCINNFNEYWKHSSLSTYQKQINNVVPDIQKYINKFEEVKRREKHYELLEIISSYIKNKTFISIDKSFKYLNVEQLIEEKNRQQNWQNYMYVSASFFLLFAIIIVCCNLCSLTNEKEKLNYYSDSIIDTNNTITRIVDYGNISNKDTNIKIKYTISYNFGEIKDSIQKKEAINFVNKELPKDELPNNDFLAIIYKSILTLTCLSLMILSLNQASRARKTMLILAKEINEFKYIEGLLKAKNEVDIDRSSSNAISNAINDLIKNHLEIQKGRILIEDNKIDEDLSAKTLDNGKDLANNLINKPNFTV